jgi:hypothetical protein
MIFRLLMDAKYEIFDVFLRFLNRRTGWTGLLANPKRAEASPAPTLY